MDKSARDFLNITEPHSHRARASRVWISGGRVYKSQPKYLTDNEFFFLETMSDSGYVPDGIVREDIEIISMERIYNEEVTDADKFLSHYVPLLKSLRDRAIRHGDLTTYSVLVHKNTPVLIDFAESRWRWDPIPPKRKEGDAYWLRRTMAELCGLLT